MGIKNFFDLNYFNQKIILFQNINFIKIKLINIDFSDLYLYFYVYLKILIKLYYNI